MNKKNRNRNMGSSYEHRFVRRLKKQGMAKVWRHYGSLGATDVEWTDKDGVEHEAQLKFSTIRQPKISKEHLAMLQEYARKNKPNKKIWVVCKLSRKPEVWTLIE